MSDRVQELYLHALEMPAGEREDFLTKECGDDAELRLKVQRLLIEAERADSFFDAGLAMGDGAGYGEREGDKIGPYTLRERIGEGGFGVVWMAQQRKPVDRKVALKVIKAGMDTKQVLARFEAERQALAAMNHPNIASFIDAGATESGRPFVVMELVKGIPVTEFCRERKFGSANVRCHDRSPRSKHRPHPAGDRAIRTGGQYARDLP